MRLTVRLNWAELIETKLVPVISYKLSFHWPYSTQLSWLTQSEEWHLFVNRSHATTSKWWTPWLLPVLFVSRLSRRAVGTMSLETSFLNLFDVSKLMYHRPCVLFITLNLTLRWGKCELHRMWSCGLLWRFCFDFSCFLLWVHIPDTDFHSSFFTPLLSADGNLLLAQKKTPYSVPKNMFTEERRFSSLAKFTEADE